MSGHAENSLILFVCTGNTCRSPMAAALFNALRPPGYRAASAGMAAFTGDPASALAVRTLREDHQIDLSAHRSRPVTADLLSEARWILTMTANQRDSLRHVFPEHAGQIMTLGEMAGEPEQQIADPFGRDPAAYKMAAGQLKRLLRQMIARLPQNDG